MTENNFKKQVHQRAVKLFKGGITLNPLVQKRGRVEKPIPIYGPKREIVSWFVGVTISDRLVGFIQFDSNLKLMRYSTFQRDPSSLEGCPKARTWLDPNYIKERSRTKASIDDDLEPPFLSYDRNISRIVWVVQAKEKSGHVKTIFVAGDSVYLSNQSQKHLTLGGHTNGR